MTQGQLARRLGVKKETVAAWENDLSEPRANKLSMMAGLLNVSIIWLLTGEGEGAPGPVDDEPTASDFDGILAELRAAAHRRCAPMPTAPRGWRSGCGCWSRAARRCERKPRAPHQAAEDALDAARDQGDGPDPVGLLRRRGWHGWARATSISTTRCWRRTTRTSINGSPVRRRRPTAYGDADRRDLANLSEVSQIRFNRFFGFFRQSLVRAVRVGETNEYGNAD